jgi:hypothetical protein
VTEHRCAYEVTPTCAGGGATDMKVVVTVNGAAAKADGENVPPGNPFLHKGLTNASASGARLGVFWVDP